MDMSSKVIKIISEFDCLANWIHLPLQSGDDEILEKMNRKHDMRRFYEIIDNIRSSMSDASIFTDVIVGFPGETENQFENTRRAFEEFIVKMISLSQSSLGGSTSNS